MSKALIHSEASAVTRGNGKNAESGFTLIELMIVIAIIGILAAIAIPQYAQYIEDPKAQVVAADFKEAVDAATAAAAAAQTGQVTNVYQTLQGSTFMDGAVHGDAVNDPKLVMDVSLRILDWILARGYAKGVDGVDLSTVLPPVAPAWIEVFQNLDAALSVYPWNPIYAMDNAAFSSGDYTHRNRFRLFYSVHSAIQSRRDQVVPKAMPLAQAVAQLNQYAQDGRYTLILHHLLVEGLNDTEEELDALIDLVNRSFYGKELRILRYNLCTRSPYHESERFLAQVRKLADRVPFIKVQVSPGSEVSAACGQFIVKDFVRNRRQASAQV